MTLAGFYEGDDEQNITVSVEDRNADLIYARVIVAGNDFCLPCNELDLNKGFHSVCRHAHANPRHEWPCIFVDGIAVACALRILT